ncbi:GDSL lipase/esterase protein [Dioscorea alata]|uniref:GDSL lipase/esterase protein n=1 Tax=Dioscorea alata TaxID=55571 RepID=A0ACB7WF23_DIOAL|nr:GDSL lipase/esterase protein [Dioscorea alata]
MHSLQWILLLMLVWSSTLNFVMPDSKVPCLFIFGDSLVDNGNNNNINSLAKANYPPYGIDFAKGPTGRFSNGLTTVDVIAKLLGFSDYIPPYAIARGRQLLNGVNFASAAAGIRDETGRQLGARIPLKGQVKNYQSLTKQLEKIIGDKNSTTSYLSKCIFSMGLGSNDYLNNYFMPIFYSTSRQYTPEQYAQNLINQYSKQLRKLYDNGARKVALIGVGLVGCSPNELAQFSSDGKTCVERINSAVRLFNTKLKKLVNKFNKLDGAHFTYINVYDMFHDVLSNPSSYGFTVTNRGCCGVGRNNGQITCLPFQTPCRDRRSHVFFDAFHPTESVNVILGRRTYKAQSSSDAYPYDLQQLANK